MVVTNQPKRPLILVNDIVRWICSCHIRGTELNNFRVRWRRGSEKAARRNEKEVEPREKKSARGKMRQEALPGK